jgi:CheY-like chemotaxis protein/HPt (histidine-containing phosphotransfer) domain-containing protein
MSQIESNHLASPAAAPRLNGHGVETSARAFSSNGPPLEVVQRPEMPEVEQFCAEFLTGLSHDLRTPLSSILGVIQMMLETPLSETHKEFAETIAHSVQSLGAIADSIGDFSRRLASHDASLREAAFRPNENGSVASGYGSNGHGTSASRQLANLSGVENMLVKAPSGKGRPPFAPVNFSTRVPPDTAKLIRILVAEDHVTNQRVMLRMLARLGYTADAVNNGMEAVNALTRSPYDIVLMDCQMPELDGYEATRLIRKGGGRFKSTPIIAVTANAMAGDREKCLASGMSDYMSKPVLAQTLATTLEKWILPDEGTGTAAGAPSQPAAPPRTASSEPVQAKVPAQTAAVADSSGSPPAPPIEPKAIEVLGSLGAGDENFVPKLIELFLDDLAERIEGLRVAAATRDGDAIKRIAHALKGSCGHFGASPLAAKCRTLEQIAMQQPVGDPDGALRELIAEADRVRIALEAAKEPPGGPNKTEDLR